MRKYHNNQKGSIMKVDILSETTLKLTLTEEDMKESRLCYEALSKQSEDCRRVLERLIEKGAPPKTAALAAELLEEDSRLLVEAFPSANGGCMVYLSVLNRTGSKRKQSDGNLRKTRRSADNQSADPEPQLLDKQIEASPIIFETASGELLGKLCRRLEAERKSGIKFSSKLFSNQTCYRLALTPLNLCTARLAEILSEYGEATSSELVAAYTQEHFGELIGKNAAELCQRLF